MKHNVIPIVFISLIMASVLAVFDPGLNERPLHERVQCHYNVNPTPIRFPLNVLVWNVAKSNAVDVDGIEFTANSMEVLQESYASEHVVFAAGYTLNEATGTLIRAHATPVHQCAWKSYEPILRTPKTSLVAIYPIEDRNDSLMVINLHGVNFSWLLGTWKAQMNRVFEFARSHHGPIIVAGDFNTWRPARVKHIHALAAAQGLTQAQYSEDHRSRPTGLPLDWVFTRGIRVRELRSEFSPLSDHNPITFEASLD